jgi:hypothetical protein
MPRPLEKTHKLTVKVLYGLVEGSAEGLVPTIMVAVIVLAALIGAALRLL